MNWYKINLSSIELKEIRNDNNYLVKKLKILNGIKKKIEENEENTVKK